MRHHTRRALLVMLMMVTALVCSTGLAAWGAGTLDQSYDTTGGLDAYVTYESQPFAQTFTAGETGAVDRVELRLRRFANWGSSPDGVSVSISKMDSSGRPSVYGDEQLAYAMIPASAISDSFSWVSAEFAKTAPVASGQKYAIVVMGEDDEYVWEHEVADPPGAAYPGGEGLALAGGFPMSWEGFDPAVDFGFRTYVRSADVDADNDGSYAHVDCDDEDAGVHPGATESYNEVDDNCDDEIDEGFFAYYGDSDSDGYGSGAAGYATSQPAGRVANDDDCDDNQPGINPGATEIYNSRDDDCDGQVDEDISRPAAPVIGRATSGSLGAPVNATARWGAPLDDGGSAITGYVVRARKLSASGAVIARSTAFAESSAHSMVMSLPKGRYNFRLRAVNAVGEGTWSATSNVVRAR